MSDPVDFDHQEFPLEPPKKDWPRARGRESIIVAEDSESLRDAEKLKGNVTIDLFAPRELRRVEKPNIKKGSPNGSLDLDILWDAE